MTEVIRKGKHLGNSEFSSINKAKNASRMLQKTGTKVRVIPHATALNFRPADGGRKAHDLIKTGDKE